MSEITRHGTCYAPVSGIITEMDAVQGARVKTGVRLFTIADPTRLWIRLVLREADIGRVELKQQVTLATDAYPDATFVGRIALIGPVVDPKTRTVHVRVDFSNPDRKLKPGMSIRRDVQLPQK